MNRLSEWFTENKLSLNLKAGKTRVVGTRYKSMIGSDTEKSGSHI